MVPRVILQFAIHFENEKDDLAWLRARYPCLLQTRTSEGINLRGTFPILVGEREVDSFKVEIQLKPSGNEFVPRVREIGGRVPHKPDRHVNESDGSACLAHPADVLFETHGEPLTLRAFLEGYVRDFFVSQSYYEEHGTWPFGQRGHGPEGLLDFCEEHFGARDLGVADQFLVVLEHPKVQRQWFCPCGNGKKLRHCHRDAVRELSGRITPKVATALRGMLVGTL